MPSIRIGQRQRGENGVQYVGEVLILLANVRRQVSLAGGAAGSQKMGVKAHGMLFCQHPLCLNADPR